ncbi:hypothetical protein B0H14DRAFT_2568192 [Mycena olivaceomarginata]|nr:hypothetical protein B0H14DRAFT_2568192 [Mycena olivaceomarginata]
MPGKMPLSEEETAKIEQVVAAYTLDLNEGSEWFSFGTNHRRCMRKIKSNLIVPLLDHADDNRFSLVTPSSATVDYIFTSPTRFTERQIIMMPDPNMPAWKAPGLLWYRARFIERRKQYEHTDREYEFGWLGRLGYTTTDVPDILQIPKIVQGNQRDTNFRGPDMLGNVRLPFHLKPGDPDHKNPQLEAIFSAAIPHVADILAAFDHNCPHILGEELSLEGSILNDLALGDVVPRSSNGPEALAAMFAVIPLSVAHSGKWAAHMQQLNSAHSFYDPDFRPLTFRCLNGPQVETEPVPQGVGNEIEQQPERRMKITKSKKKSGYPGYVEIDSDGNEL